MQLRLLVLNDSQSYRNFKKNERLGEHMISKSSLLQSFTFFFTKFIRISDVIKWTVISGIGFIMGLSSPDLIYLVVSLSVFLITTLSMMSFTFGINNYYDVESDKENPRRRETNIFVTGQLSKSKGLFYNGLFCIIALLITLMFRPINIFLCSFILLWMWLYSAPPIRFKSRPPFDIFWHFIGFFLMVLWGSAISNSFSVLLLIMALSIGVFSCIGQLWNHFVDYTFDRKSGIRTYAVDVGLSTTKKTLNYVIVFHLILLIPLIYLSIKDIFSLGIILILVPLFVYLVMRPWKGEFPKKQSFQYYFTVVTGGTVYFICMLYKLITLYG